MKLRFDMRLGGDLRIAILACILALCGTPPCGATVLDWSQVAWTPGSLTGSFDIDPSNPGNDVTVTITDPYSAFAGVTETVPPYNATPTISTEKEGGMGTGTLALLFELQFPSWKKQRYPSITVAVAFDYANGVSLDPVTLFDIDNGGGSSPYSFVDVIKNISGQGPGGATLYPTLSVTNSSIVQVANSGTVNATMTGIGNSPDRGVGSEGGNADLSFGTNAITSFTFTYSLNNNSQNPPSPQGISLYDLSYTAKKVPEVGVLMVPFFLGVAAMVTIVHRRIGRS